MKTKLSFRSVLKFRSIKTILPLFMCVVLPGNLLSQQIYDDFEGTKVVYYAWKNGIIDTTVKNPSPNNINNSSRCAKYIRNKGQKFDNIKMPLNGNLTDISAYTTYSGVPPKLKMKVYTTAPAGTMVEILLGNKSLNNTYPAGTNSQFQAYTSVSGEWEELEFKFAQIPEGSETSSTGVDQVTLLFSPNTNTSDTYYFDEITGPAVISPKPETLIKNQKK